MDGGSVVVFQVNQLTTFDLVSKAVNSSDLPRCKTIGILRALVRLILKSSLPPVTLFRRCPIA